MLQIKWIMQSDFLRLSLAQTNGCLHFLQFNDVCDHAWQGLSMSVVVQRFVGIYSYILRH